MTLPQSVTLPVYSNQCTGRMAVLQFCRGGRATSAATSRKSIVNFLTAVIRMTRLAADDLTGGPQGGQQVAVTTEVGTLQVAQ